MDLSGYRVGSIVKIDLYNGYYFKGVVLDVKKDSISIKDKNGELITLSSDSILFMREVSNE